jgi:Glycosyltransferases, probably involved in cell wall biogenesis
MQTRYVLITPARNEELYIERTIVSVINQTILPLKYIIISDGSTDHTDTIAKRYAAQYDFIEFVRRDGGNNANFSSKVFAFNLGVDRLRGIPYDFIGNLDADISLEPGYFEKILKKFEENPKLGIAGGQVWEDRHSSFHILHTSLNSVAGAVMLFRRACYEAVGGYIPIAIGGEDTSAEITARARGWIVQMFTDIKVRHNKPLLSQSRNILESRFKQGMSNYILGYHPLFQFFICIYRIAEKPVLIGSMFFWAGFCWAKFKRMDHSIAKDVIAYLRKEQLGRLADLVMFKKVKPL